MQTRAATKSLQDLLVKEALKAGRGRFFQSTVKSQVLYVGYKDLHTSLCKANNILYIFTQILNVVCGFFYSKYGPYGVAEVTGFCNITCLSLFPGEWKYF